MHELNVSFDSTILFLGIKLEYEKNTGKYEREKRAVRMGVRARVQAQQKMDKNNIQRQKMNTGVQNLKTF